MLHCFLVGLLGDTGWLQHVAVSITARGGGPCRPVFVCVRVRLASSPPRTRPFPPFPPRFPASRPPKSRNEQTHLDSLDLQLHVILPGGLPVFPLLPTVAILSVLHLLPIVQDHGTILRPGSTETGQRGVGGRVKKKGKKKQKTERNMKREDFLGGPARGLIFRDVQRGLTQVRAGQELHQRLR